VGIAQNTDIDRPEVPGSSHGYLRTRKVSIIQRFVHDAPVESTTTVVNPPVALASLTRKFARNRIDKGPLSWRATRKFATHWTVYGEAAVRPPGTGHLRMAQTLWHSERENAWGYCVDLLRTVRSHSPSSAECTIHCSLPSKPPLFPLAFASGRYLDMSAKNKWGHIYRFVAVPASDLHSRGINMPLGLILAPKWRTTATA
jgi:hypothetical protein